MSSGAERTTESFFSIAPQNMRQYQRMTGPRTLPPVDSVDRRILATIQNDGRISLTELAAAIPLGLSATRIRLQKLQESGVIEGYSAHVDPAALGYPLRALVRLSVHGRQDDRVFAIVEAEPRIVRCLRVTGEICFVFEIVAADMAELEGITLQLAKLGDLATDMVYEVVSDRAVPV